MLWQTSLGCCFFLCSLRNAKMWICIATVSTHSTSLFGKWPWKLCSWSAIASNSNSNFWATIDIKVNVLFGVLLKTLFSLHDASLFKGPVRFMSRNRTKYLKASANNGCRTNYVSPDGYNLHLLQNILLYIRVNKSHVCINDFIFTHLKYETHYIWLYLTYLLLLLLWLNVQTHCEVLFNIFTNWALMGSK